jgi:hypothetical protein
MVEQTVAQGTNQIFSHERATLATPEQVWALWTDVRTWQQWDKGLKNATLNGAFVLGATGKIIPLFGPTLTFTITAYDRGQSYTFSTKLPLASLTIERKFIGTNPTCFRHIVHFSGFLGRLWAKLLGPGFRTALPVTMDCIAALAETSPVSGEQ